MHPSNYGERPVNGSKVGNDLESAIFHVRRTTKRKHCFKWWLLSIGALIIILLLFLYYLPLLRTSAVRMPILKLTDSSKLLHRGAYLANHVAVCMDCHSERDWSRYSGPLVPGTEGGGGEIFNREMGFPGTFYSKNITPTHLGTWTDDELLTAVTTGVKPNGEILFPVMPYPYYRHLDPEDAVAIIAYIRTLAPKLTEVPERTIDFPMQLLMRLVPRSTAFKPKPARNDRVAYGKYLATIAGCAECHSPVEKGQVIQDQLYAGGRLFKMPAGDLYSPNLTADSATGLGLWSEQAFINRFKFFADSANLRTVGPRDQNTIMPWSMYSGMDTADLGAIYAYLRSLPVKTLTYVHP